MKKNPDSVIDLVNLIENEMAVPHRPATLRALREKYSKLLESQYGSVVIRIAQSLLRQRVPGMHFMAYELIRNHPKAVLLVGPKELFRLGAGLDSTEAVDLYANSLVGPAWREGRLKDDVLEFWAKTPNRWYRRAALMSTISLNSKEMGGAGDTERTLKICSILLDDRDEIVVKAMASALGELNKRDRASVTKFIEEHHERIAPRVLREAGIKVPAAKKDSKAAQ